jgi:hypothetical protein
LNKEDDLVLLIIIGVKTLINRSKVHEVIVVTVAKIASALPKLDPIQAEKQLSSTNNCA